MFDSIKKPDFGFLFELRNEIGPRYGSEDLCMLLYSIVKREKPAIVIELGTGLGVTTAWIAAAMLENGVGKIYSIDNGSQFLDAKAKGKLEHFAGRLEGLEGTDTHHEFVNHIFKESNVQDHVRFINGDIDLKDLSWLDAQLRLDHPEGDLPEIDIVFSDYNHSIPNTVAIVSSFLPRMTEVASIFIDSASTAISTYYMLERLVQLLNEGRVPKQLLEHLSDAASKEKLSEVVANSIFKLMHLVEKQNRRQNSTTWLRIERNSLLPALALTMH